MKLYFTTLASDKIKHLISVSDDLEFGCFGLLSKDFSTVEDIYIPPQIVSSASVDYDAVGLDRAMADCLELGYEPEQSMRCWIHLHPFTTAKPKPSSTDEETFDTLFGKRELAFMIIFSASANYYARVKSNLKGYSLEQEIDIERLPSLTENDIKLLDDEYLDKVKEEKPVTFTGKQANICGFNQYKVKDTNKGKMCKQYTGQVCFDCGYCEWLDNYGDSHLMEGVEGYGYY
jgi:hypothetical protein